MIDDDDVRAFAGEFDGAGLSDARVGAGDERVFADEFPHED